LEPHETQNRAAGTSPEPQEKQKLGAGAGKASEDIKSGAERDRRCAVELGGGDGGVETRCAGLSVCEVAVDMGG